MRIILKNKAGTTNTSAFEVTIYGSNICLTYNPPAKTDMAGDSLNRYVTPQQICIGSGTLILSDPYVI